MKKDKIAILNPERQILELTKQNEELENYFRNTIIPQLFVDENLVLRKFTPPAMKQFKLSLVDLGKKVEDIKDNFRFPSLIENIQQVINSNEILEKEIQTTDLRWYQMNIIPYVSFKSKKTNGVIITFVEITMRIKDLKEQEKLIADHETLLDTISHDIKTPLTSLMLTVNMLKKASLGMPGEFENHFKILESSVKKMQTIIRELTDVGKQKHRYGADLELLSFENILEDVRLTLSGIISESGAVIKSEINISEILYSRRKLRSIIYNLVNNAIKFKSPERKPEIFIKTQKEKNHIVILIRDNGIGIDAANQDAIFTKYFRMQHLTEGSGIGLYLVSEIVKNSGGRVSVKSTPGIGSEFKVYLKLNKL